MDSIPRQVHTPKGNAVADFLTSFNLDAAFGRNQINELDVLWHGLPTVPRWRITIHLERAVKVGRSGDQPTT